MNFSPRGLGGWDAFGNLLNRTDNVQVYDENFCYDLLNRLTNYTVNDGGGGQCNSGTIEKSIAHDGGAAFGDGNITTKSDLGGDTYGGTGYNPPHTR